MVPTYKCDSSARLVIVWIRDQWSIKNGIDEYRCKSPDITRSKGYDIGLKVAVPWPRLRLGILLLMRLKY